MAVLRVMASHIGPIWPPVRTKSLELWARWSSVGGNGFLVIRATLVRFFPDMEKTARQEGDKKLCGRLFMCQNSG